MNSSPVGAGPLNPAPFFLGEVVRFLNSLPFADIQEILFNIIRERTKAMEELQMEKKVLRTVAIHLTALVKEAHQENQKILAENLILRKRFKELGMDDYRVILFGVKRPVVVKPEPLRRFPSEDRHGRGKKAWETRRKRYGRLGHK